MKLEFDYSDGVLTLPEAIMNKVDRATKKDLKILFLIAAEPMSRVDFDAAAEMIALHAGVTRAELDASIGFWRGAGVISSAEQTATEQVPSVPERVPSVPARGEKKEDKESKKKIVSADELPQYTSDEIEALLARRAEASELIDLCQQTLGKMFNTMEINILLGLLDYLSLDREYILMLFAHCAERGKKSLKYIERMAFSLYSSEVETPAELEEYFKNLDAFDHNEKKVRDLFGMKGRAMTSKEKAAVTRWFGEWEFEFPVVERAYEITINNINKPSVGYTSAILERWHKEGYKTVADVEAGLAEYAKKKESAHAGSFDTDEFFEAALRRSYSK